MGGNGSGRFNPRAILKVDGETYATAYRRVADKLSARYTKERNDVARLKRKVKMLEAIRHAAYEYLDARTYTGDTAAAAHRREAAFARLRFALLTYKRSQAQKGTIK